MHIRSMIPFSASFLVHYPVYFCLLFVLRRYCSYSLLLAFPFPFSVLTCVCLLYATSFLPPFTVSCPALPPFTLGLRLRVASPLAMHSLHSSNLTHADTLYVSILCQSLLALSLSILCYSLLAFGVSVARESSRFLSSFPIIMQSSTFLLRRTSS